MEPARQKQGWVTISSSSPSSTVAGTSPLGAVLDRHIAEKDEQSAHTPALPTLRAQQRDLRERLRNGVDSRIDLLMWSHAAAATSTGHVPDGWFSDLLNDRWVVAGCLNDPDRRAALCGDRSPDAAAVESVRLDIVQDVLSPGFQTALSSVRRRAMDHTDDGQGVKNTDKQRFLAMRPRLHQIAVAQHKALRQAFGLGDWEPLSSREDVIEWSDYCGYAAAGFLSREFTSRVASPLGEWWGSLTNDRGGELVSLLAAEVLPRFNAALRVSAAESDEMASRARFDSEGGNIS